MNANQPRYVTCLITALLLGTLGAPIVGALHDGDPVDDNVEALMCGFTAVAGAINSLPPEGGRCVSGTNYVHPWFNTAPTPGDADADRFQDSLEDQLCGRQSLRDLIDGTTATFGHYCANSRDYSPPTTNAALLLPTAAIPGVDGDNDGFPSTITLTRVSIVFRPFGAVPIVSVTAGENDVLTVDVNDADPNVPALSILMLPEPVPMGQALGSDADGDGFPTSVTISRRTVTFDRRAAANAVTFSDAAPIVSGIDPVDSDPNTPLVSVFTVPVSVPLGTFSTGADADRDGFPTTLTMDRADITFDRRNLASPASLAPAAPVTQAVDSNDANPDVPVTSIVVLPAPIAISLTLGVDSDGDDVPSAATVERAFVTFDRRGPAFVTLSPTSGLTNTIDPNDADPDVPAASTFGPISVPISGTHSPDADDDYVPHHVTISFIDVTVDRRSSSATHVGFGDHATQTTLDADDAERGEPVPFDVVDDDADSIPDAIEPEICRNQNVNTPDDGQCGTPDGNDMSDYTPPVGAPNPWDLV